MINPSWRRGNRNIRRVRLAIFGVLIVALLLSRGNSSATTTVTVVRIVVTVAFLILLLVMFYRRRVTDGFGRARAEKVERRPSSSVAPSSVAPSGSWSVQESKPTTPGNRSTSGLTFSGQPAPEMESQAEAEKLP